MSSSRVKYDSRVTGILQDLRINSLRETTQQDAADYFEVRQRQTIANWEAGILRPPETRHRERFQLYLLERMNLRNDTMMFHHVWNSVMVEQWEWAPLTAEELRNLLPGTAERFIVATPPPILMTPSMPDYSLVGREVMLEDLRLQLMTRTTVALYGLPGVGKTALAIELANHPRIQSHYIDGVLWASLGPDGDVLLEMNKWGTALNILPKNVDNPQDHKSWAKVIHERIRDHRFLLVIDDVWDIDHARNLRLDGPRCGLLITTRFPKIATNFAKNGETHIPELNINDGLQVLNRLAPHVVNKEPVVTRQLVEAVGGLPLALMLMGSYLREQSHSQSSRLIENALEKLNDAKERLRVTEKQPLKDHHPSLPIDTPLSLEAMITVSYEQLQSSSRHMLSALSILPAKPNTFFEEAAVAISDEPVEILDQLYDYGLIESAGAERYTLHQTVAEYARLKLTDALVEIRMGEFFTKYVHDHQTDFSLLDMDSANVRVALEIVYSRGLHEALVRGTNAFYRYLETRGVYKQALLLLERAEIAANAMDDKVNLITILHNLGKTATNISDYSRAGELLDKAFALANSVGYESQISGILQSLGAVAIKKGEYKSAKNYIAEGLSITVRQTEDRDHELEAQLLQNLGLAHAYLGDNNLGETYYLEGLALARNFGLLERASSILSNLASMFGSRGNLDQAETYGQEGLVLAKQIGHREHICVLHQNLGGVAFYRGDFALAKEHLSQGLSIAQEIGSRERSCSIRTSLGVAEFRSGNFEVAEAHLQRSLTEARDIGHIETAIYCLENLGSLVIERDEDYQQAIAYYTEGLNLGKQIANQERIVALYIALGHTIGMGLNDYVQGEAYLTEALELARVITNHRHIASALKMQGELYFRQGRFDLAEVVFVRSLEISKEEDMKDLEGDNFFGLAQVCFEQGRISEAYQLGKQAFDVFDKMGHHRASEVKEWLAKHFPDNPLK